MFEMGSGRKILAWSIGHRVKRDERDGQDERDGDIQQAADGGQRSFYGTQIYTDIYLDNCELIAA
jgi:hypothetical protein